jgi:hypothetical protein
MSIDEYITTFAGLPVVEYDPYAEPPADPGAVALRLSTDYEGGAELLALRFNTLAGSDWAGQVRALVFGLWSSDEAAPPVELIAGASGRLTGLRALFLGDQTADDCEISWINQTDHTPIFKAYPELEVFTARGGTGLLFPAMHSDRLRELTLQTGGMPGEVVRGVGESTLPALQHLELWLGTTEYGGSVRIEDLDGIFAGTGLPALRSLGLRNAEITDEIAARLAGAPVVARLERLDLSLGVLGDAGAAALLSGQPLTHLRELDLHDHYISEPMRQRLHEEYDSAGVRLDLSDGNDSDSDPAHRFPAVAE